MNPKTLALALTAFTLISFAIYTTYPQTPSLEGARPLNPQACNPTNYPLTFQELTVAADIVPGQPDRLDVFFMPNQDGKISLMTLEVYKFNVKIHTIKSPTELEFKSGQKADYVYQVMLPKFIPHINVTVHMNWFDNSGDLLSCVKYDLHL